jgi:hypothetical protein
MFSNELTLRILEFLWHSVPEVSIRFVSFASLKGLTVVSLFDTVSINVRVHWRHMEKEKCDSMHSRGS